MSTDIEAVLAERGKRYGTFAANSALSQQLKDVIRCALGEQGKVLPAYQMEAIEMICHKLARVVNGDSTHVDNFIDIAGYASLAVQELKADEGSANGD